MSARQWLASHRTRYARLREELGALDRGLVEIGLIAAQAIERLDAQDAAWTTWRQASGRATASQSAPQRHLQAVADLTERVDALSSVVASAYRAEGMPVPPALDDEPAPACPVLSIVRDGAR
jgi:hypothetical protein